MEVTLGGEKKNQLNESDLVRRSSVSKSTTLLSSGSRDSKIPDPIARPYPISGSGAIY
jgi:hypothetical protein